MLPSLIALALFGQAPVIDRDNYGVPHIKAATSSEAFFQAGYAVAQDRLWQIENSRRLAEGRMSEVFGKQYVASDREVLLNGYTTDEIQEQLSSLPIEVRASFDSYAKGVNEWIAEATAGGQLPSGYAENDFKPEPWTAADSAAIAIRLLQLFGRSSAGQLRDLALLTYLQGNSGSKDKALDVFDDLLWQNDPSSPTTVKDADDPIAKTHYQFPPLTRAITEAHLAKMPKVGIFELLPGISLASNEESKRVAELNHVPYRTGSYAVAVAPSRSVGNYPILLSGPQMGFTEPSIVHEMSIESSDFKVVGMDIPGVPGIAVGYTPNLAWGLTTGVADVEDIVYVKASGADGYEYDDKVLPLQKFDRVLKVKGEADQHVVQLRTMHGPVVIKSSSGYYFARHASTWKHELDSYKTFMGVYRAKSVAQLNHALDQATMNFNFIYAMSNGDIGYRYLGRIPARAAGLDPRLPVPGEPRYAWQGMIQQAQLPHVENPKGGLVYNWNNKPATWWNNGDTPVWGRIFHSSVLGDALNKPKLTTQDVEIAAWTIARTDPNYRSFAPILKTKGAHASEPAGWTNPSPDWLQIFDGRALDGSVAMTVTNNWLSELRKSLFQPTVGNLMSPDLFAAAIQPSVILNAIEGKTKVDYLAGRLPADCREAAYDAALQSLTRINSSDINAWRYRPGGIRVGGQPAIPYSNRGTYIQVVELLRGLVSGRNVLPPGIAESGGHSQDQAPLSRAWTFKPMYTFPAK